MSDAPNVQPDPVDPPTDPPADPPAPDLGKDGTPFDAERAQRTIETLRAEIKQAKVASKERDELAARLKEHEDAQKSELDKAKDAEREAHDRVKNATEKLRNANLKGALYDKAVEHGIGSPSLALKALDRKKIEWDDDDEPSNLDEVLVALLEEEPLLKASPKKKTVSTDAGGGSGSGEPPSLTQDELEAARLLGYTNPADYAADKELKDINDWEKRRARSAA